MADRGWPAGRCNDGFSAVCARPDCDECRRCKVWTAFQTDCTDGGVERVECQVVTHNLGSEQARERCNMLIFQAELVMAS